jgi:hypothetical protein
MQEDLSLSSVEQIVVHTLVTSKAVSESYYLEDGCDILYETSVLTRATRFNIPRDIRHSSCLLFECPPSV